MSARIGRLGRRVVQEHADPPPLRAELFSADQMEQHGKALPATHVLSRRGVPDRLLKRLEDNRQILLAACSLLTTTSKAKLQIAPAGVWLLDNFELIEEQIRTARRHLPKGYSRELPQLEQGSPPGLPRVYDLALEAISHGDGRVDAETLERFVAAYQTITPLTLGELWAVPIMLRLALIENLRRVATRITSARHQLNQAQNWADLMMETVGRDPKSLILVIADMVRSDPPMTSPFVAELARRLQGRGPLLALPLTWIEHRLAESSLTIERVVQAENQQQAADQVSISNTIGSLRSLEMTDWRVFVEAMSLVEQVLKENDKDYGEMDFATRDRYRHVIDRLAKHSNLSEIEIARKAVDMAHASVRNCSGQAHRTHVGYYLIDAGLPMLERATGATSGAVQWLSALLRKRQLMLYLGSILLMTGGFAAGPLAQAWADGVYGWRLLLLAGVLLLAASHLASALTNWLATLLVMPNLLPRMDYSHGLPSGLCAMIVVPTLLDSTAGIEDLLEALEVRFLGNQDEQLYFGLLTDFVDAGRKVLEEDASLLQQASNGIERLNDKYPCASGSRFFLFHRERCWNPSERIWMGFERKRGKLSDLNALLRGDAQDRFAQIVGDLANSSKVRYVITLDADTQLPRDAARLFVSAMAHPLNRPRYDERRQRVCGGYGILQPRIAASLFDEGSRYARLCGSEPGIDPYTRSVSDVYQDVFGEGSFIGKGIYDVEAFEHALKGRLPLNRILSHDLLEGCYARSGLLSDVPLYEAYPASYFADIKRRQRWIRGDWQIACWLLPGVPSADRQMVRNPLSALSRWKILDNLRRDLAPAALLAVLFVGWSMLPHPGVWTLFALGIVLIPALLALVLEALRLPDEVLLRQHLAAVLGSGRRSMALAGFRLASLPHEVAFSLDAILRTCWRLLVSRRDLLEWSVSAKPHPRTGIVVAYRRMWATPLAAAGAMAVSWLQLDVAMVAMPIGVLWLAAPAIVWWLNRPLIRREPRLSPGQVLFLRRNARKTWAFFERFVGAEDHWLPPDNYQESPGPVIAHRTSPTNIGLALLANLSACDFGFIPTGTLIERTGNTFRTMQRLPRYLGHFYNWYDTQTLQALPPHYISSVDSGNLAGHLLTLRSALLSLPDQPIVATRLFDGLADTFSVLIECEPAIGHPALAQLSTAIDAVCMCPPMQLRAAQRGIVSILQSAETLAASLDNSIHTEAAAWVDALAVQCRTALEDLYFVAPWLRLDVVPSVAGITDIGFAGHVGDFDRMPTLLEWLSHTSDWLTLIDVHLRDASSSDQRMGLIPLREAMATGARNAALRVADSERLAQEAAALAVMEYDFLYDRGRHQLSIGYNVDEYRRDSGCYDLLASEARFCTFVAIAQGMLPQESWFALGRPLTRVGGAPALVSWSGSMFEYLMPLLVMPDYADSLLGHTCRAAVKRQIDYGKQRRLPWGVSESAYNALDASLNYQYHAFGVPGLGLQHGLGEDAVIAPYASTLALIVAPEAACANLQRLAAEGLEGPYGFYEAVDYTRTRQPRAEPSVGPLRADEMTISGTVIHSFMAHHQGMSLLALAYLLLDRPMQRRFEALPQFQATLLLLQEKIPKVAVVTARVAGDAERDAVAGALPGPALVRFGAQTPMPEVQLLSNGRYHVMVNNVGGGYSRWQDLALTRWQEDSSSDHWGSFIYLRDVKSGDFWSATHQPTLKCADSYEAIFSEGRAEYRRLDHDYEAYSKIVVSPEDDVELRRLRITNRSAMRRTIEVTSYAEVVLAPPAADALHPSFGNLFVQTQILQESRAILCTRRPRSAGESTPWMFHLLAAHGTQLVELSYETDRMHFVGRGNSIAAPQAMRSTVLSGSEGSVLNPIVAIRCRIVLEAEQSATVDWVTGVARSRSTCVALVDKYQDRHLADRAFDLAWTHSGVMLRQINACESDAQLYRRLAGAVLYAGPALRADPAVLTQNHRGQSGLWGYAISGDLPIVLLKIADTTQLALARQLIQCHAYWRLKGLSVDLVIWNEDHVSYRQQLQDQIMGLITTGADVHAMDRPGGIFVRFAEQIASEDRILLQAVARAIISGGRGTLAEQLHHSGIPELRVPRLVPSLSYRPCPLAVEAPQAALQLANGFGGFSPDGSEYVITTTPSQSTPLPWVNVLANPRFGTVIAESGLAYTWSENAHEFRLTPWNDDPIGATGGEALYLRDEETGHFWSPTPAPCRGEGVYISRHGFGYSVFEHSEGGIHSELWVYVDLEASVKYSVLKLRNISGRSRQLSASAYVEWVLGDLRAKNAMHVVTTMDSSSGALFARNAYNTGFGERVAFLDVDDLSRTLTGDRREFLGRNGTLERPDAMTGSRLSGRLGAGLDSCGAIQVSFGLQNLQERQVIFRLGAAQNLDSGRVLARRLRTPGSARAALEKVRQYWRDTLGAVQIETPDPALNLLANGWLIYQTLACRLWARSGFYQSGGAFGFRDQLQDAMALVHAQPRLVREHLLRAAERQYPEGDVQHWWHPPGGQGVRTRCSDDYLWLPLAVCRYVQNTGDTGVLDEVVAFIEGRALDVGEESYYAIPNRSSETASLYQHCVRAIEYGLRFGEHGLPLMGSGDWNDGMNLVGINGKGESVWLGFFLYDVLGAFAGLARGHGDPAFAARCVEVAEQLRRSIELHGWDGGWYRRAYFDDGTLLGSSSNAECTIDSIPQSWSVLSGAGDVGRSRMAMQAMHRHLVRREQGLVQLLDPPFNCSDLNPGYIKGYVPGVRENGGQYTHAAIWAAMAFARLGDSSRAWELLDLINPLNHARNPQDVAVYKAEPYVVAADVYALAPHTGRGGWTWYTGSAGWLYRLIVESLLGLQRQGEQLRFAPCMPTDWERFAMCYRYGDTSYRIQVRLLPRTEGEAQITVSLDAVVQADNVITLVDDHREHSVEVYVSPTGGSAVVTTEAPALRTDITATGVVHISER